MTFSQDLKNISKDVKNNLDSFYRSIALSAGNSLVMLSPVDTGRFRNNWNFSVGQDDTSTSASADKTGTMALGRLRAKIRLTKMGDTVYMTNNLPYALRLENGWSQQRPAEQGIVKETSRLFDEFINDALKGLK